MLYEVITDVTSELRDLAVFEGEREIMLLGNSIPIDINLASIDPNTLRSVADTKPFAGKLLGDWFSRLRIDDKMRLDEAIRNGIIEGDTVDQIVRRIRSYNFV